MQLKHMKNKTKRFFLLFSVCFFFQVVLLGNDCKAETGAKTLKIVW
jgi:hypothetical protein